MNPWQPLARSLSESMRRDLWSDVEAGVAAAWCTSAIGTKPGVFEGQVTGCLLQQVNQSQIYLVR